jgi:hypothetical protein
MTQILAVAGVFGVGGYRGCPLVILLETRYTYTKFIFFTLPPMGDNYLNQKRFSILVIFIIAFCLMFSGMRVPDITRPHRPKPSQRAVIESPLKVSQYVASKSLDFFAVVAHPPELQTAVPCRTMLTTVFSHTGFPPLFPNSSRAPPRFLS